MAVSPKFDGKKCHVTPIIVNPELKSLHIGIIEDMKYKYEVTISAREKKKELEEAISMHEDKDVTKEFEIAYPNLSKEFLEIQSQQPGLDLAGRGRRLDLGAAPHGRRLAHGRRHYDRRTSRSDKSRVFSRGKCDGPDAHHF